MIVNQKIELSKFIDLNEISVVFDIIAKNGGVARFVGGFVRDALMGYKNEDIDIATDLSAQELIEIFDDYGYKTVPIGVKHGTIGVVVKGKCIEITTLREDVYTDGRHAKIKYTDSWEVDAARRDLTINAIYSDIDGNVFDYHNGYDDLMNGRIRFIGNPKQRVEEDYVRILRFFRFYAKYASDKADKKSLRACVENADKIVKLSNERVRMEFFKILRLDDPVKAIKLMRRSGVMDYFLPEAKPAYDLSRLVRLENKIGLGLKRSAIRRLAVLVNADEDLADSLAKRFRVSKDEKQRIIALAKGKRYNFSNIKSVNKFLYKNPKKMFIDIYCKQASRKRDLKIEDVKNMIKYAYDFEAKEFPIGGKDLIAQGIPKGTKVGRVIGVL